MLQLDKLLWNQQVWTMWSFNGELVKDKLQLNKTPIHFSFVSDDDYNVQGPF